MRENDFECYPDIEIYDECQIWHSTDQGSHFTSPRYTKLFLEAGFKMSMALTISGMVVKL